MEKERKFYVKIKDFSIIGVVLGILLWTMSMSAEINWHWPNEVVLAMITGALILFIPGVIFLVFSIIIGTHLQEVRERKVLMIEIENRIKELEDLQKLTDGDMRAIKGDMPWKKMLIPVRVAAEDIPNIRRQIESELGDKKEVLGKLKIPTKPWTYAFCQKIFRFKGGK